MANGPLGSNDLTCHFLLKRRLCLLFSEHGCFACVYLHVPAWCPQKSEEGTGSLGTQAMEGWELPCGCWVPNLGPPGQLNHLTIPHTSLSFSQTNMQGILMIMASKQGMAAVVFGDLPCSCDGLGHFEPSRMLSCSETVLLPSLQSSG